MAHTSSHKMSGSDRSRAASRTRQYAASASGDALLQQHQQQHQQQAGVNAQDQPRNTSANHTFVSVTSAMNQVPDSSLAAAAITTATATKSPRGQKFVVEKRVTNAAMTASIVTTSTSTANTGIMDPWKESWKRMYAQLSQSANKALVNGGGNRPEHHPNESSAQFVEEKFQALADSSLRHSNKHSTIPHDIGSDVEMDSHSSEIQASLLEISLDVEVLDFHTMSFNALRDITTIVSGYRTIALGSVLQTNTLIIVIRSGRDLNSSIKEKGTILSLAKDSVVTTRQMALQEIDLLPEGSRSVLESYISRVMSDEKYASHPSSPSYTYPLFIFASPSTTMLDQVQGIRQKIHLYPVLDEYYAFSGYVLRKTDDRILLLALVRDETKHNEPVVVSSRAWLFSITKIAVRESKASSWERIPDHGVVYIRGVQVMRVIVLRSSELGDLNPLLNVAISHSNEVDILGLSVIPQVPELIRYVEGVLSEHQFDCRQALSGSLVSCDSPLLTKRPKLMS